MECARMFPEQFVSLKFSYVNVTIPIDNVLDSSVI